MRYERVSNNLCLFLAQWSATSVSEHTVVPRVFARYAVSLGTEECLYPIKHKINLK